MKKKLLQIQTKEEKMSNKMKRRKRSSRKKVNKRKKSTNSNFNFLLKDANSDPEDAMDILLDRKAVKPNEEKKETEMIGTAADTSIKVWAFGGKYYKELKEIARIAEVDGRSLRNKVEVGGMTPDAAVAEIRTYQAPFKHKTQSAKQKFEQGYKSQRRESEIDFERKAEQLKMEVSSNVKEEEKAKTFFKEQLKVIDKDIVEETYNEDDHMFDPGADKVVKATKKVEEVKVDEITDVVEPKEIELEEPILEEDEEDIYEEKHISVRPRILEVIDPAELIQVVQELKWQTDSIPSTINLIDFENLCGDHRLKSFIDGEDTINVFFYNASVYSDKFYRFVLSNFPEQLNIKVLSYESAPETVDHLITYYLGALRFTNPTIKYNIVSSDRGYCGFVDALYSDKVECVGVNKLRDPEQRFKFSMCKYILYNTKENKDLYTREELFVMFKRFYKGRLSTSEKEKLIENLVDRFDLAKIVKRGGSTELIKIDLPTVREFVELNKG